LKIKLNNLIGESVFKTEKVRETDSKERHATTDRPLIKKSVFNEMLYLEKRQKDKQFGKLCKKIMKHQKNRI
jgi:ribosome biogenesis GTPase